MNAESAETLLRCFRPGQTAEGRMQKAVKFAEQDSELRKKFDEQMAFDQQIIDVIHYITPPENLREKLTGLSAQPRAEKKGLRRQMVNPAMLTAIMGVICLLGVIGFVVKERMEKFAGREDVEGLLGTAAKMSGAEFERIATTPEQLGDWLLMGNYEGYESPPELAGMPVVGWRVFYYDKGRRVAQAAIDKHELLLYEFHANDFGVQLPDDSGWVLLTKDAWVGALRQHQDHCVLLAFLGSKSDMHEFLKTLPKK